MPIKRLNYIDQAKGIAILLLLFCHTAPGDAINTWIFLFHMPIFFIVGGILLAHRTADKTFQLSDVRHLLARRCGNLLLPYLVFCLLLTIFYASLSYVSGGVFDCRSKLIATLAFQGVDSLWFIPCYFWSELVMSLVLMLPRRYTLPVAASFCLLGIIVMSLPMPEVQFLRYLTKITVSLSFFSLGYIACHYNWVDAISRVKAVLLMIISSILGCAGGYAAIGGLVFPYWGGYFVTASIMSIALLAFLKSFDREMPNLQMWGKYSIVVLCTNNLLVESIRFMDSKITGNFLLVHGLLGCCVFFMILYILEYYIIRLSQGRLGVVFGK